MKHFTPPKQRRDVTNHEVQRMKTLASQGLGGKDIAKILGRHKNTVYIHLPRRRPDWEIPAEVVAKAREMRRNGVSLSRITAAVGFSRSAIWRKIHDIEPSTPHQTRPRSFDWEKVARLVLDHGLSRREAAERVGVKSLTSIHRAVAEEKRKRALAESFARGENQ